MVKSQWRTTWSPLTTRTWWWVMNLSHQLRRRQWLLKTSIMKKLLKNAKYQVCWTFDSFVKLHHCRFDYECQRVGRQTSQSFDVWRFSNVPRQVEWFWSTTKTRISFTKKRWSEETKIINWASRRSHDQQQASSSQPSTSYSTPTTYRTYQNYRTQQPYRTSLACCTPISTFPIDCRRCWWRSWCKM